MNVVVLAGNLVRDPEGSMSGSGMKVVRFTVAINRFSRKSDNKQEADFIRVVCFDKQAEIVEKYPVPLYNITIDYAFTKKFDHLLKTQNIICINKEYQDMVSYVCYIHNQEIFSLIQELTNNNYSKEFIREEYIELPQN